MKSILYLSMMAVMLGASQEISAYKIQVQWDNPGSLVIGVGSPGNPEIVDLSPEQTGYVYENDEYAELCVFPAEGYVLTNVNQSGQPEKNNSIMPNAVYGQQSYYGVADSWDGRVISVTTAKMEYDGELTVNVINGADCLSAYLDFSRSEGSGAMKYSYGYQKTLSLSDSDNRIPFSAEYMENLTVNLKKGTKAESIYSVVRNGEKQTPIGTGFYMENISATDVIEIQVFENQAPPAEEEVSLTLDYPESLDGCVMNLFNRTTGKFLGVDANYVFTMPDDHEFRVGKGSEIQVNFNEGYTFTGFRLNDVDITDDYIADSRKIRFTVGEDAVLSISGGTLKYDEVEFTAYVINADGVRLRMESYQAIPNPIKDVTGQPGESIAKDIEIPSFTFTDKNEDDTGSGNGKTVPAITMTSANTLKFSVKVSERSPYIYVSPASGYYIQSLWSSELNVPVGYIDGNDQTHKVFYVVAQRLDRDSEFKVEMTGDNEVDFRASPYFQGSWDNPSISFSIGEGDRTYCYNEEYDNPFTLYPKVQTSGFSITLNGRMAGITQNDNGSYTIDFSKAYETDRYPVPTLKVNAGSTVSVEGLENDRTGIPVYNIHGMMVSRDWETLPSGLYVRDGKKILKK